MLSAKPNPGHKIVNVGQMVIDFPAAEGDPVAARHSAVQLQESPVAWTVDARWTDDRHVEAGLLTRFSRKTLPFELRRLVYVARSERRVFVRGRMLDITVNAYSAAMNDASSACARRRFHDRADGRR